MNLYSPAFRPPTEYERCAGPVNGDVSPDIGTFAPVESWITTLWGAALSWLSNVSVKALSAAASSVVGSKPPVAAPEGAATVRTGAFASMEALGPGLPDAPAPPASALR